jgi:dolichol kinase
MFTGWNQTLISAEEGLWLALAAFAAFREPWVLTGLVGQLLVAKQCASLLRPNCDSATNHRLWRKPKTCNSCLDEQGAFAGTVLAPVLLNAVSTQSPNGDVLGVMATAVLTLMFDFAASSWIEQIPDALRAAVAVYLFSSRILAWNRTLIASVLILNATYHSLRLVPRLQGVFTKGEWKIVSSLAAAVLSVGLHSLDRHHPVAEGNLHGEVAFVGAVSCLGTCWLVGMGNAVRQNLSLLPKIACLTLVPVMSIEVLLATQSDSLPFPRSMYWLVDFLLEVEETGVPHEPSDNSRWFRRLASLPRYCWLIYWVVVLVTTMTPVVWVSSSSFNDKKQTVVARKWFHLVTVLLFAPVTMAAPQLQSLSYAIAMAGLMVLEAIRSHLPALNAFYVRFLDPVKEERDDSIIVSHMALVVGCAAPLWIAEYCSWPPNSIGIKSFLSLWGVLCLGVGDAIGAVVGILFGKHCWSASNSRTIEGSTAMFLSVALPCCVLAPDSTIWIPAVVFTTLLEAWTRQLDNLILPLAGSAAILLVLQRQF